MTSILKIYGFCTGCKTASDLPPLNVIYEQPLCQSVAVFRLLTKTTLSILLNLKLSHFQVHYFSCIAKPSSSSVSLFGVDVPGSSMTVGCLEDPRERRLDDGISLGIRAFQLCGLLRSGCSGRYSTGTFSALLDSCGGIGLL